MSGSGWIGVDLDGTLAHYDGWKGIEHIGDPIPKMLERVKRWVEAGMNVKILTARCCRMSERDEQVDMIHDWLITHGLPRLEVTNIKDFGMIELWDDRAVQVVPNTGDRADGKGDRY